MRLDFRAFDFEFLFVAGQREFDISTCTFLQPGICVRLGKWAFCRPACVGPYQLFKHRSFDFDAHTAKYQKPVKA